MKRSCLAVAVIGAVAVALLAGSAARAAQDYKPDANAPRSSVPSVYKWDLAPVFPSEGAWEKAYGQANAGLKTFVAKYKGKVGDKDGLAKCLKEFFPLRLQFDRVAFYTNLRSSEDEDVTSVQVMRKKSLAAIKDFQLETAFVREAVMRMDPAKAEEVLRDADMKEYAPYLVELRRRTPRLLSPEAEKVLAQAGDNLFAEIDLNELPSDLELTFKAAQQDIQLPKIKDEDGKEVQLQLSNYGKYRASKDRDVRRGAVESFFAALKKHQDIFAATLGGEFKRDIFLAKARGYQEALAAYLDMDNLTPPVVDGLISAVHQNLKPLRRYVELRKKLLGLKDVHIYDLYTPLVPSADAELPYGEAQKDVVEALKPLGQEYVDVLSKAIVPGSGWVDIYPNKGKESGAFSTSVYGVHPYIKLNYMNMVDDASTLAHEFGHTMHSYLNAKAQPYPTAGYATILAEIASTLNEKLLNDYLLKKFKDDDKTRLALLGERLESIRTTIFRQTLFAEFERKMHAYAEAGTPLTPELFNKTYGDLVKLYYGPGYSFGANDDIEWAYIPHFYWKFYVFSYATGLSAGISLADKIGAGDTKVRDGYLKMLQSPSTEPPLEILKRAGVDLTKPDVVTAAAKLMDETITEIDKIWSKQKGGKAAVK